MADYSQTRSFNLGIAQELSVEAALIYNDLAYAQASFGDSWFFRSYEQLMNRLPYSERTLRTHVQKLVDTEWIEKKSAKVNGKVIAHYRITRHLTKSETAKSADSGTARLADSMETAKSADSINSNTKTTKSADAKSLLALVNKITGRDFRTLPRGSAKTLDTFTLAEIETALTALAADPWHRPKLRELSSDYLLRATTIDRFRSKAPAPGQPPIKQPTFTEDDDGNQYYKGERITPQNQERIMRENYAEREGRGGTK